MEGYVSGYVWKQKTKVGWVLRNSRNSPFDGQYSDLNQWESLFSLRESFQVG